MPISSAIYTTPMSGRGFRSKSGSIKQLIQEEAIDILILTETNVYTQSTVRLDGFKMFPVVKGKWWYLPAHSSEAWHTLFYHG